VIDIMSVPTFETEKPVVLLEESLNIFDAQPIVDSFLETRDIVIR